MLRACAKMPDWLRSRLGIVSPARALRNSFNGTATEAEEQLVHDMAVDFLKMMDGSSDEERKMFRDAALWNNDD